MIDFEAVWGIFLSVNSIDILISLNQLTGFAIVDIFDHFLGFDFDFFNLLGPIFSQNFLDESIFSWTEFGADKILYAILGL